MIFSYSLQNLEVDNAGKRSSRSPSPQKDGGTNSERRVSPSANGEYILQAGKLITMGLEYEKKGGVEEAFDLFKAGVDVLLSGVQSENWSWLITVTTCDVSIYLW